MQEQSSKTQGNQNRKDKITISQNNQKSLENLQLQNQNQSIMFQKYFEKYNTCLPYNRQNFMIQKDLMKQFIIKKNILKLACDKAKSKFEEVYSKSIEDILKEIQSKFVFIDSLLTDFPFINDKTYQAYDDIKEESLSIHNMLFIIAIKQIIGENENEENKNIDYQECKKIIQAAKKEYKASYQNQLEENLKKKYQQQKKRKYLFQKSNNKEKLNQTKKTISKIEDLLNILKQYIKSKELYVQIAFGIPFFQLQKEILVTMDSTGIDIFNSLELQNHEDFVIQIFKREDQSYVILENNKKLKDIVQKFPRFKGKIKKIFIVTFQNQSYKFSQNTSLQIIKDKLGSKDKNYGFWDENHRQIEYKQLNSNLQMLEKKIFIVIFQKKSYKYQQSTLLQLIKDELGSRNKTYGFWDENHRQIEDKQLNSNLQMFEFDQNIKLVFNDKLLNNFKLPSSVSFRQLVRFINLQNILPLHDYQQNKKNKDPYSKFFIRMIETNEKTINILDQQMLSINDFSREAIRKLFLSYRIYIIIDLLSNRREGQFELISYGDVKIKQLKNILMQKTGLNVKAQQWFLYEQQQLKDEEMLFIKLDYINDNKLKIDVKQVKNWQYYGFSKIKEQISSNLFFDYSIEDDQKFLKQLKISSFPDDQYQFPFRTACLRIIFAAMKKHCSISSAIKYIKQMISQIRFQDQNRNDLKDKIWRSFAGQQISRFNEGYILHYLLLYSSGNLRVAIMNAYKNQSPIFYRTFNSNNQAVNYHNEHFWLSSKSLVIASIQMGDKPQNHIKGKTNALNMIFQTKFEDASLRNYYCSKSISIAYNIYRNEDLLVNVVDISSGSCSQQQKIAICNACNIIIIHYVQAQRETVKKRCQDVFPHKICILLQRDNASVIESNRLLKIEQQNNQYNRMRKHYTLPELTNEKKHHYANKLSFIVNEINSLIQSQFLTVSNNRSQNNHNNLWMFLQFLQQNKQQKINAIKTFKSIEQNFQSIVNLQILMRQPEQITSLQLQTMVISQECKEILKFITSKQNSQNYFLMLRNYIRSQRNQRIKQFRNVQTLLKLCQNKQIASMSQQDKIKLKNQIMKQINTLIAIPAKRKNKQFERILVEITNSLNEQDISQQIFKDVQQKLNQLDIILNKVIKQRQFSIQNLWRGLSILFNPKITVPNSIEKYKDQALHLFNQTFKQGSYFQIINGETMEVTFHLMKTLQQTFLNAKKIIVIGVLGPQSSGKSTLLNYLFGCDFACSDGRCTSGVYGTYYQISGGIYKFDGILILDTEGLFSTYERKIKNYDNMLVLFLIKICDIIIINTKGDIDGKCEQIVEVSFNSEFMEYDYPHVFTTLNQNGINLDMAPQQQNQVRKFIKKIIDSRKGMAKYISLNQAQSLPSAFSTNAQKKNSSVLQRIQKKLIIPTELFYNKTKHLSLKIIKTFKEKNPRVLNDVLNKINEIWRSLIKNPTYTQFTSKYMRLQSIRLERSAGQYTKKYLGKINEWINSIPNDIREFENMNQQREKKFKDQLESALQQYQRQIVDKEDSSEAKQLAKIQGDKIKQNMELKFNTFRLNLEQKKKELQLKQFKQRGLYSITDKARKFKKNLKGGQARSEDIQRAFDEVWQQYTRVIINNNKKEKISQRKYEEVKNFYQQYLNEQEIKINLNYNYTEMKKIQLSLQEYSSFLLNDMRKNLVSFRSYFTETIEEPLIITSQNINRSAKGQYLRMWQFFRIQRQIFQFYLNKISFDDIWNKQTLKLKIAQYFRTQQTDTGNINYFKQLHKSLYNFLVKVKPQYMQNFQNQIAYKLISILEDTYNSQLKINYQMKISKEYFDFNQKEQWSVLGYKINIFQPLKKKQTTIKKFEQFFKQSIQSNERSPGWRSLLNFHRFLNHDVVLSNPPDKQQQNNSKSFPRNTKKVNKIKKLAQRQHPQTQLTYIKILIQQTLNFYIQTFYQQLSTSYKKLKEKYGTNLRKIYSNIGLLFLKDDENRTNQTQLNSINGPLEFSYNQHNQYEIKGYKLAGQSKYYDSVAEMHKSIKNYSLWINSHYIISNITEKPIDQQSILIAKAPIQKNSVSTSIKMEYQNNHQIIDFFSSYLNHDISSIAQKLKSPILKQTIEKYINNYAFSAPIFNQIDSVLLDGNIEDYFRKIHERVKLQIYKFNQDLRQISHCLFKEFIVQIYNYSACLLSKKLQILQLTNAQQNQSLMEKQRVNQFRNFKQYIESNQSKNSAVQFIKYYQKHLSQYLKEKKYKYIDKMIDLFLQKYSREKILLKLSQHLINSKSASQAQQYLRNPRSYLDQYYKKLIQKQLTQKIQQIQNVYPNQQITQFLNFFKHEKEKIKQKYRDYQIDKSEALKLFTHDSGNDHQNLLMARVFLAILKKNPQIINENYNNNQFKVKKQVNFNADYTFKSDINKKIILRNDIDDLKLSISNYYEFLTFAQENLLQLKNKIIQHCKLTDCQRQNYKQRTKPQFCNHQCPFCEAYCQVDLRFHKKNPKHKCFIGHQLRAMKNVTIQLKHKGVNKKFGSIYRCQQILDNQTVSFNGREKSWREFKQQNKQWNFETESVFKDNDLNSQMWRLAGKTICEQKQNQTGEQFVFISCSDFKRYIQKIKKATNHYIFSIDSSGFHLEQYKFKILKEEIKMFLSQLQQDNIASNKVSIIVWGYNYTFYYRNANIQQIDMDKINIKWSTPFFRSSSAFKGAIEIIQQCNNNQNIIFIYVVKGIIGYPKDQIDKLIELKNKVLQNQLSFISLAIKFNQIYGIPFQKDFKQILEKLESQVEQCVILQWKFNYAVIMFAWWLIYRTLFPPQFENGILFHLIKFMERNKMISSIIY